MNSDQQSERTPEDRRSRGGLRVLVDEMMAQIRDAATHDAWTPEERDRAESDLLRIMMRVRAEALGRGTAADD